MFVDFNRVFNNKPQAQITVPDALVNYLNQSLPEGVKYVVDDSGNCVITSEEGTLSIGGVIFTPNEEYKKVLGKKYTREDVLDYSYNAQKPIPLTLKKEGYITLNGQEFPIERMSYNPLAPVRYHSGTLYMYPNPFPAPFEVSVGCDGYERRLLLSRVPHNSINIAAFESDEEDPLRIKYRLNTTDTSLTLDVTFNLAKAKTIRDIVESTTIYNAFLDGKGLLMGHPLEGTVPPASSSRFDDNSAAFWKKVLAVEDVLGVKFSPPKEDVDFETICLVEQLYQNLINKTPTREKQVINFVEAALASCSSKKSIEESVGHPMLFEFETTMQLELFGVHKELPALMGIFNGILAECVLKGEKYKLSFSDESPEKKRFTATMCFRDEAELKSYRTTDHNKVVERFKNAKAPYEHL